MAKENNVNTINDEGFLKFGRIKFHDIDKFTKSTHWVELSDEAWQLAHQERRARYERIAKTLTFGKVGID